MQEHKIKVEIDSTGKITAETFGIEGTECIDELTELLKELGEVEKIKKKPEYYKNRHFPPFNNKISKYFFRVGNID